MNKQAQLKALAKRMKPMHLKMAIAITEGMNQTEAYTAADGKGKNPGQSASQMILNNIDILLYAEISQRAIVAEAQERGVWDMQRKTEILEDWITRLSAANGDKGMIDAPNALKALAEHNKMTGDLAPIKTDNTTKHSGAVATTFVFNPVGPNEGQC